MKNYHARHELKFTCCKATVHDVRGKWVPIEDNETVKQVASRLKLRAHVLWRDNEEYLQNLPGTQCANITMDGKLKKETELWVRGASVGAALAFLQDHAGGGMRRVLVEQDDFTALQHTATHCDTLQYTATHCNTLHHTARHASRRV